MNRIAIMLAAALAAACSAPAFAQAITARSGDHPAVVVQRLCAKQGYDYVSKFYPHPAWLYLAAEAPRPMSDHPAVLVARREQQARENHAKAPAQAEPTPVASR